MDLSKVRDVLAPVHQLARRVLAAARPVRLVAFNKSEASNWSLPWHQDRVIAVRERFDLPGYVNWTRKVGVWHVEPPTEILQRMLFARVHLDRATEENGCMELALGSDAFAKVIDSAAEPIANRPGAQRELCIAERGDVLLVKALTLHRSRASQSVGERRALRIDYAAEALPSPLEWEFSS
jgi:ectoine hydroxylase-related dioxygenase (phytanoyl-CoA dioxygenase family)